MRFLISIILFLSTLFAYKSGDEISPDIRNILDLNESKIYIIDFFASWCPSCEKEMPYLLRVNDKIDKNKIEIIGVGVDEDIRKGEAFIKKTKITFKTINDPKNKIVKEFDPVGMPAIYIIKENKIADSVIGAKDNIDKILFEKLKGLQ